MPPPHRPPAARLSDPQIQTLLTRHQCPTPMHVLRMRLLGAIASPRLEVSPIQVVTQAPLEQTLTHNGVTVEICIYKGGGSDWILEVVDAAGNSHVWDDPFATDQQAFDEAMRALDEEPLEFMEPTPGSKAN